MNEKIENLLNLALEATPEERKKSINLDVGYDAAEDSWEVVVKYSGSGEALTDLLQVSFPDIFDRIQVRDLSNEYAILRLPQSIVEEVASFTEIEYMEKPKRLFFAVNNGKSASCINQLQVGGNTQGLQQDGNRVVNDLSGQGVIVAVIDSGVDYAHPDFRNTDGTTRIIKLWDQTLPQSKTTNEIGRVFDAAQINEALNQPTEQLRFQLVPSRDLSGHGTHVLGIAAGNGRASNGKYRGVAYRSELLVVKLGTPDENALPRTTELMEAVDFCVREAEMLGKPVVLNLSFGNNYGSHSGTSLIETYLNDMANYWRNSIVIGSGNEGNTGIHTAGNVQGNQPTEVELVIGEYETGLNLQIWKDYSDEFSISLVHPNGTRIGPLQQIGGPQRFEAGETRLLLYYGTPSPYSPYQEIYFDFIPKKDYIDSGDWKISLVPQRIVTGRYDMWLPSGGVLNPVTGFLNPVPDTTLTIPSTASRVITVGAYDALYNQPASFSGRGYTRETNQVKPDLVAPGVDITSAAPGGGYAVRTGTSMATPFVTGSAALLMEWGIVRGNDFYLYGEKIRAYLQKGAKQLPGFTEWPNRQLGWGTLCLRDSLPG